MPEVATPFQDDPVKQERFERFLKEKYQGGLRSTDSGGASAMSEAARARERLDFEAAAEAIEKAKQRKEGSISTEQLLGSSGTGRMLFTSGGLEVYFIWWKFLVYEVLEIKLLTRISENSKLKILKPKI